MIMRGKDIFLISEWFHPYPDRPFEKYMDPEPLVALWPLRVPLEGSERGLVTTVADPGVPIGSMPLLTPVASRLIDPAGAMASR